MKSGNIIPDRNQTHVTVIQSLHSFGWFEKFCLPWFGLWNHRLPIRIWHLASCYNCSCYNCNQCKKANSVWRSLIMCQWLQFLYKKNSQYFTKQHTRSLSSFRPSSTWMVVCCKGGLHCHQNLICLKGALSFSIKVNILAVYVDVQNKQRVCCLAKYWCIFTGGNESELTIHETAMLWCFAIIFRTWNFEKNKKHKHKTVNNDMVTTHKHSIIDSPSPITSSAQVLPTNVKFFRNTAFLSTKTNNQPEPHFFVGC